MGVQVRLTTTAATRPVLVPQQHPAMRAAARAVQRVWQVPPVLTRSGGSTPLVVELWHRLKMPTVLLGFGLPDDGAHAANERLHLPTFFRVVETVVRFLEEYGA
ncbi:MAG: M20/M25/M40 family metallo-hydrolase [Egibacteraceae bacterium]